MLKRSLQLFTAIALAVLLLPTAALPATATSSIDPIFTDYYNTYEGLRVLGYPLTELTQTQGYPAQYFEKGRIEDHRSTVSNSNWRFMYGLLAAELMTRDPEATISTTTAHYGDIMRLNDPAKRNPPPAGFSGGVKGVHDGMFVPFDPALRPAPGYVVAPYFWAYINRAELFPGGWLHDIGLPLTDTFEAKVTKDGQEYTIFMQAFERAVLTYDMRNPVGWQVEKGNIGADALRTAQATPLLEVPAPSARVTLPLHILARIGRPGEQLTATLTWQDNTRLSGKFTALAREDGGGLVIGNLDWINMLQPPEPETQPATLELRNSAGSLLASRQVTVVSPNDPDTVAIKLYWTISGTDDVIQLQTRRIIKTQAIGTATLQELLWGPPEISQVGFRTAIPTPQQVLGFPGRQPGWGPRVTLRSLNIANGVATANFAQELAAYGGGSLRVKLIREQISQTLMQFPSVRQVVIAVEGRTAGVLEP